VAVSSGLRSGELARTAADGAHAATAYEARKQTHQDTEAQCRDQGLQFLPLLAEGCGGWGPTATQVWRAFGRLAAAHSGQTQGAATEHLLQALSVTLQRENARAIMRRMPSAPLGPESFVEP